MKFLQKYSVTLTLILLVGSALHAQNRAEQKDTAVDLQQGFANPPQEAKLRCYWWWLNGYTTQETITRELTAMKEHGYAGVLLVDDAASQSTKESPMGPPYGSAEWMKLYLHALKVAKDLGLEISLEITNGGNVGILGGPGVSAEDAIKLLTWSRTQVHGGSSETVSLPAPPQVGGYYRQIAVLAYPLHHGAPLAGTPQSNRSAILELAGKSAIRETCVYSMPVTMQCMPELFSTPDEQDADLKQVVNLTAQTSADGTVRWNFPAGDWEVLRVGYTASGTMVSNPSGTGYAVDAMSAKAFDHYFDRVITPILSASKPYIGSSLKYIVTDSWEAGGDDWTDGFREQFIRRRGYDPVPYLPVVAGRILDSRNASNRFLADLRLTIADLIAENYYDHFAARAAAWGLGTHPEAGGPHAAPFDSLRNFKNSTFTQAEYWAASPFHRTSDEDRFFVKEAASAAHIYGKKYIAAEGFSTINPPWSNSPGSNLKPAFDRALTEGLNRLIWHEFTSSPEEYGKPGIEYFADTHLDPNVTWWNQSVPVLLSMNRAQFLLQQGTPVADLLYFYGDNIPTFARLKSSDPAYVLPGYEYDVTDEDALLRRMIVSNGRLHTPEGIEYRALTLPNSQRLSLQSLQWLEKFVHDGGVAIGLKPTSPDGLVTDAQTAEYNRTTSTMWGNCRSDRNGGVTTYGSGKIYCTMSSHFAFTQMQLAPDFSYKADDSAVSFDYVHRHTVGAEIYFVRNVSNVVTNATLSFRVHGRAPELWHADSGDSVPALVYRDLGEQTEIPLAVPAYGSVFVIFRKPSTRHAVSVKRDSHQVYPSMQQGVGVFANITKADEFLTTDPGTYEVTFSDGSKQSINVAMTANAPRMDDTWKLSFPVGWGAPESIIMNKLQSWTDSFIPGVRYFSGTATYTNTIHVPAEFSIAEHEVWLDLGDVREVATVSVNGKELDTLWHAPFLARIDAVLHADDNTLSIRVTNLWPNRIIGDQQPEEKVHYTKTNIIYYTKDSPLMPSGLLAPVRLVVAASGAPKP